MKRRPPLESLRLVRERVRNSQRAALSRRLREEHAAVKQSLIAETDLALTRERQHQLRSAEDKRLRFTGVRASEGQQRNLWLAAQRVALAQLARRSLGASRALGQAQARTRASQVALARASSDLDRVQRRLERLHQTQLLQLEAAEYDSQDDANLHRMLCRTKASMR